MEGVSKVTPRFEGKRTEIGKTTVVATNVDTGTSHLFRNAKMTYTRDAYPDAVPDMDIITMEFTDVASKIDEIPEWTFYVKTTGDVMESRLYLTYSDDMQGQLPIPGLWKFAIYSEGGDPKEDKEDYICIILQKLHNYRIIDKPADWDVNDAVRNRHENYRTYYKTMAEEQAIEEDRKHKAY